ncbi:MAG: hypothetical protein JXM70_22575 [Pirellulales bacterium]|nr:hypothetical protein [Pirellulales bacterium]
MRKLVISMLCLTLLVGMVFAVGARAADIKPVAVVSLSGYDNILEDIELVGELSGRPHLRMVAEGLVVVVTKGQGPAGLDKKRPWGMLVGTDGKNVGGCSFVPVTDLDKLMSVAKGWDKDRIKKTDNGIYEIKTRRKTLYVQETHKGWAFIVDNKDLFQYVPANPARLLSGLNVRYDIAARIYVANIPLECREKMCDELQKRMQKMTEQHKKKHKPGRHLDKCKEIAEHLHQHMKKHVKDIEQVTLGWSLDNDLRQCVAEVSVVAKKGTKLAKQFSQLGGTRTNFGGFELPETAISGRITSRYQVPEAKHLDKMIDHMRAKAYKKIDKNGKAAEHAKVARKVVDTILDVVKKTAASGHLDCAAAVSLDEEAATLIAGRYVADGPKLESAVKMAVNVIRKKHPECIAKTVKLDAGRYRGVNLHVATIPITDKCPKKKQVVEAMGENLEIVLGIGPKAVYLATGRDAMVSLKQAIQKSQQNRRWTVPPMEFTLSLEELLEYAEEFGPPKCREAADKADDAMEKAYGRNSIRVVALPSGRSVTLRMELDEGVLRAMSSMKHHKWPGRDSKCTKKQCDKK